MFPRMGSLPRTIGLVRISLTLDSLYGNAFCTPPSAFGNTGADLLCANFWLCLMLNKIYKLLIVDDSEDERMLLAMSFRRIPSCEIVASLPGGQAAIDYFSGINGFGDRHCFPLPDVMLLDFRMPCVSAPDVLAWLRTRAFPELRVIVLSHYFHDDDIRSSLNSGARLCLSKRLPSEDARAIADFCNAPMNQTARSAAR